jgi:hypothetical protein
MQNIVIALLRSLLTTGLLISIFGAPQALAQESGEDVPGAREISEGYSPDLARYYAPYALQAAAAYNEGTSFKPDEPLPVSVLEFSEERIVERATKYVQAWRFQFGHEGYLTCFESDADCENTIRTADRRTVSIGTGPAFHVWARAVSPEKTRVACSEVSIAFRGTSSFPDWISNGRGLPLIGTYLLAPFADDHYRQLRRNVGAIIKKITTLDCYRRAKSVGSRVQIVSVGHSLGGGLAQLAALANPVRPRVSKVFACDPSPVTGADLVEHRIRSRNSNGLEIDRIFQSGEVLERFRQYRQEFPPSSSACNPFVRNVRFGAFRSAPGRVLHNMQALSREMVRMAASRSEFRFPWRAPDCPTRYRPPATDEYESPGPVGPGEIARVPNRVGTEIARVGADRAPTRYAEADRGWSAYYEPNSGLAAVAPAGQKLGTRKSKAAGTHAIGRAFDWQTPAARVESSAVMLGG